ncbi:uncharacterized protein K452DRAFT_98323 [Aplosporella prunicola CBS 121167]|uniref:Uncharacterized protein n=1 Tax=Aplosporella prunicola CBS 121167 TaxID=1176127 RepID=A0A6A6B329_9PEZI|nr:uncharacterized protein K452DRAFT_98323 [Aplosporella prunicola CBS 121167]KAF2137783.1 hypothetical protein K452DRAFT_98323 [Aplosporella prunicola CBS 121167]
MSDWWDDFSNNLATDLGPLISLFGETPTKQYLSECLSLIDIIIFASCPLGILTAVVSAIRVCGTPSLRAFIGRAQEGGGSAEAELCSSTSRDVCELYNNGGIARVFGRPKLLEFVHITKPPDEDFYLPGSETPTAGIHASKEYFDKLGEGNEWIELGSTNASDQENQKPKTELNFAPNPNLSLNVGIKPRHQIWFIFAAALGVALQCAVLLWALIARYTLHLLRDGSEDYYAVPMTIIGTVLLCIGMAFCASLIERSTDERVFQRKPAHGVVEKTSIYWVQPGNQHVGDQVFDSFAYTGNIDRYTTSWKKKNDTKMVLVWTSVSTTMVGFLVQFLGLRACHSSVAVAQLGAILLMSFVRAMLRTERLKKDENLFNHNSEQPDLYQGHELDQLALWLGGDSPKPGNPPCTLNWHVSASHNLHEALQKEYEKGILPTRPDLHTKPATRYFYFRARLGELTGLNPVPAQGSSAWDDHQIAVRQLAKNVAQAVEKTIQILFDERSATPVVLSEERKKATVLFWPLPCMTYSTKEAEDCLVYLSLKRENSNSGVPQNSWRANISEIEAALGLWLWSLKCRMRQRADSKDDRKTRYEQGFSRLLSLDQNDEIDFEFWRRKGDNAIRKSRLTMTSSFRDSSTQGKPIQPPESPSHSGRPLFGWHLVPANHTLQGGVDVLEISTTSSLAKACAQDIYSLFLLAALTMVENIGGKTLIESPSLLQVNGNVSSILETFTTSGLGSTGDAFSCILPALKWRGLLPRVEDAFSHARTEAGRLVKAKEWDKAKKLLLWVITHSTTPNVQSEPSELENHIEKDWNEYRLSLLQLCECYRKASLSINFDSIGIEGMSTLLENHINRLDGIGLTMQTSLKAQDLLADALRCYGQVALAYAREHSMTGMVGKLEGQLRNAQHTSIIPNTGLYEAVRSRRFATALYHLDDETNSDGPFPRTTLSYAAEWGWYPVVQNLVENGSPVGERDTLDRTPLSYAAANGDQNTFSFLLDKDSFPDSADKQKRTALSYAAENNHLVVLEMLLKDQRVNAELEDDEGRTALWWAVRRGHEKAAHVLLQKSRVKSTESSDHGKLLHWAVVHGMQSIAEQIIKSGVDVNVQGNYRNISALEAGSAAGHESIVKLLLSKGADPNIHGGTFTSPLEAAKALGHETIAKMLLESKADPCIKVDTWNIQDMLQRESGKGNESIVHILLDKGADVNAQV